MTSLLRERDRHFDDLCIVPLPVLFGGRCFSQACAQRFNFTLLECDFHNRQRLEWIYADGDDSSNCETPLPPGGTVMCDHVAWHSGTCTVWCLTLSRPGVCLVPLFFFLFDGLNASGTTLVVAKTLVVLSCGVWRV